MNPGNFAFSRSPWILRKPEGDAIADPRERYFDALATWLWSLILWLKWLNHTRHLNAIHVLLFVTLIYCSYRLILARCDKVNIVCFSQLIKCVYIKDHLDYEFVYI